jgi:hypothetical protein
MEHVRVDVPQFGAAGDEACEERVAPRFTLLIRAAKIVAPQGEFIAVIRDVSSTGVSLRGFHPLPGDGPLRLELQTGESHVIEQVWQRGNEAGFRFVEPVEVHDLVAESGRFPKRQLRLNLSFPVTLASRGQLVRGELTNLSQQGARIDCSTLFAIAQPLSIQSTNLPDIVARVRWRRVDTYGVVFDTTFSLKELALFAAAMQAPELLVPPDCASALRQ